MMPEPQEPTSQNSRDFEPVIDKVVQRLRERFGDDLQSVVLYGSYARGSAGVGSDLDMMVIVPSLPREWRDVFAMEDELAEIGQEVGQRLDIRLFEAEAVAH